MAKHRTTKSAESLADDRILDAEELLARIPLDRSTIYRMVQAGTFPAPLQLTSSRIGWRLSSILQWLAAREAGHLKTGPLSGRDKDHKPAA